MYSEASVHQCSRATGAAFDGDGPEAVFALLADGRRRGVRGMLVTIVGVDGGSPRPPGTHMAVLADGRYCGYLSGGCLEAAMAAEALGVLRGGRDAVLRFGRGSSFIDIRLPCGGGLDAHVHLDPAAAMVDGVLAAFGRREAFTLALSPEAGAAELVAETGGHARSAWENGVFRRRYRPRTRLVAIGQGPEFEAMLRLARGAGLELWAFSPDVHGLRCATDLGASATQLKGLGDAPPLPADPWTAIVFMFHDHDRETALLMEALESPAFHVGALGSRTSHALRCARLRQRGVAEADIARVRGPLGLFGPTRDATSFAVSALAQIIGERYSLDGV